MEKKWWHDSVVYQIYPRSFNDSNGDGIGDIQGIIEKLDYLALLGIDLIWLSPVYQSPMDDNGYDISDYQAIAPEFGSLEDMDQLINQAKQRDIKIIMDLVVNHTSDEHPWFKEARSSINSPYRDYYIWRKAEPDHFPNDIKSIFGGPAWQYDEASNEYYFHLFSSRQPDLNWENPQVRHEVNQMMNWWLDRGIGGFRMDVIDLIGKDIDKGILGNGPNLHPFLKAMNQASFGHKDVLTVGETWGATPEIAKLYSSPKRHELSMVFQFEHITAFWDQEFGKWAPKPFHMKTLKRIMNTWQTQLKDQAWNSLFWNNHDLPRVVSKYGDPGKYRVASAKMLATLLHMQKGTPYIYQGEELGMTNVKFQSLKDYDDIETKQYYKENIAAGMTHEAMMEGIYANSRDNARTPMQWSDDNNAGFTHGKPWLSLNPNYREINARQALKDEHSIFYHYQKLISLRKENPLIVYGDFKLVLEDNDSIFAFTRTLDDQVLLVINNFSSDQVCLNSVFDYKDYQLILSNYQKDYSAIKQEWFRSYRLSPYESIIISCKS